jgi:hypothetical protein
MAAGRSSSSPRPFWRVLALTGTPTSASRWLSSRSWTARRRALGSADGRSREGPWTPTDDGARHRPHHRLDPAAVNSLRGAGLARSWRSWYVTGGAGVPRRSGPALSEFNDLTAETVASSPKQPSGQRSPRLPLFLRSGSLVETAASACKTGAHREVPKPAGHPCQSPRSCDVRAGQVLQIHQVAASVAGGNSSCSGSSRISFSTDQLPKAK